MKARKLSRRDVDNSGSMVHFANIAAAQADPGFYEECGEGGGGCLSVDICPYGDHSGNI